MERQTARSKAEYLHEVIPAFLAPDHILRQRRQENDLSNPLIDIIEDEQAAFHKDSASDFVIRESLHRAIEKQHIDLFMQPIVTLPQRRVKFYEFFGRLRVKPGTYIAAQDYMTMASEEHIISNLDTIFLADCLKILQKQRLKSKKGLSYFINIKPFTLRNHDFMNSLLYFLSRHKNIAHAIIFEMNYNEYLLLSPGEKKILRGLAEIGCRFSIDHISYIPTDISALRLNHIHFIKINAKTLRHMGKTERGFSELLTKKHNLDVNHINLIVDKTENESDLKEILDFDIKYGQGFLFGRPDFQGVYTAYKS